MNPLFENTALLRTIRIKASALKYIFQLIRRHIFRTVGYTPWFSKRIKNKPKREILKDFDAVMKKVRSGPLPEWDKL